MFHEPTDADFAAIAAWGLDKDPLRAAKDFSSLKDYLRWVNPHQRDAHVNYVKAREANIQQKNYDNYYKTAEKPIDRRRWEYLKARKAWYIMPLEWQRFAEKGVTRILDLGCGDGDVTQRIAEYIVKCWDEKGYEGHKLEISGYDLNPSRIANAKLHCKPPRTDISFHFDICDVVGKGVQHPDKHFDYVTSNGVLEILEDTPVEKYIAELCRIASKGVYIEDLADRYPGGYPRTDLEARFNKYGFRFDKSHYVFTEPFMIEGSLDPMNIWPILKCHIFFAVPK